MTTNNDNNTSAIDEKKEQQNNSNNDMGTKIKNFLYPTLLYTIIYVLVYFVIGSSVLYICKLSQSNILPSDINCYPYTEVKPEIQDIDINIFTTFTTPKQSMKIKFPYSEENSYNWVADFFEKLKENPKTGKFANYFISIFETVIANNYNIINSLGNFLNESLHELLILLFGPIIFIVLMTALLFYDNFYLMYLWFNKMEWFFKENVKEGKDVKPVWEHIAEIDLIGMSWGYFWMFMFFILFFIMFSFGFPLFSFVIVLWSLFSCLSYKCVMNDASVGISNVISGVFKYYKTFIMIIISYYVIKSVFINFGNAIGGVSIAAFVVCIAFFAKKYFQSETINGVSPISSYKQATKICKNNTSFMSSITNVVHRLGKNANVMKKLASITGNSLKNKFSKEISKEIPKSITDKLKNFKDMSKEIPKEIPKK